MPVEVDDILVFKHFQRMNNQEILNVFTMQMLDPLTSDTSNYYAYARGFYFKWVNLIRSVQSTILTHVRTEMNELTGIEQGIYAAETPVAGTKVSPPLPIFNAASIQFVRSSRLTRHGWKRIAGLCEADTDGDNLASALITLINTALSGTMQPGGSVFTQIDENDDTIGEFMLRPVIIGDPVEPSTLYRINPVTSTVVKPLITTQNTRKIGRGS